MNDVKVLYDTSVGGIRAVKLDMGGFLAAFSCNERLGHCTARIEPQMPMAPDILWAGDTLAMTYHHLTIDRDNMPVFEKAYEAAKNFCLEAAPYVRKIMTQIEKGDALAV